MNAIVVGLSALVAGLLLLGLLLWRRDLLHRHQRARAGRRQAGVESADNTHAVPWPKSWRGIPGDGDDAGRSPLA